MKIIKLKQAPVVLVEIPIGWAAVQHLSIGVGHVDASLCDPDTGKHYHIGTNLKMLGILSGLTEEQFAECVNVYEVSESINIPKMRFYQMLESEKVYTENPYRHPDEIYTIRDKSNAFQRYSMKKWQEAQSRTIDPKRTLVLLRKEEIK